MNNKGFAISGILYTIFVLFMLVLFSALGTLNSKRLLLEKNVENVNEEILEKCYRSDELTDTEKNLTTAYYTGKYTFANGCVTYVYKGTTFSSTGTTCINSSRSYNGSAITEICTIDKNS